MLHIYDSNKSAGKSNTLLGQHVIFICLPTTENGVQVKHSLF